MKIDEVEDKGPKWAGRVAGAIPKFDELRLKLLCSKKGKKVSSVFRSIISDFLDEHEDFFNEHKDLLEIYKQKASMAESESLIDSLPSGSV